MCAANYACNAVGGNDGKCVAVIAPGAACKVYAAATGTPGGMGYTAAVPAGKFCS